MAQKLSDAVPFASEYNSQPNTASENSPANTFDVGNTNFLANPEQSNIDSVNQFFSLQANADDNKNLSPPDDSEAAADSVATNTFAARAYTDSISNQRRQPTGLEETKRPSHRRESFGRVYR